MARILALSMVRNEQDIIEPFVRHTLRFVDHLLVVDNASVDRTREILVSLSKELEGLAFADRPDFAFAQSEFMTQLMRFAQSAFFADYIFILDADEFIGARNRQNLEAHLCSIPKRGFGLMPWQTYVLSRTNLENGFADPPRSMVRRRRFESPLYEKAVFRADGILCDQIVVAAGNHSLCMQSGGTMARCKLEGIPLYHFPVRSDDQLKTKAIVGWIATLKNNNGNPPPSINYQWRENFQKALNGRLSDEAVLVASWQYAQKADANLNWHTDTENFDHDISYVRKYSDGKFQDPLAIVAASWERSVSKQKVPISLDKPVLEARFFEKPNGTIFSNEWHWDNSFIDVPPFLFLAEKLGPRSVLDIGCGIGAYLKIFEKYGGAKIFGVDGLDSEATVLSLDQYKKIDLQKLSSIRAPVDLVMCIEVLEHLPELVSVKLIRMMAENANKYVLFSAAEPGQPGNGHINCQSMKYWISVWQLEGWTPDLQLTLSFRALASLSWLRRNVIFLKKHYGAPDLNAVTVLEKIADKNFSWYKQKPGIRNSIIDQETVADKTGYER